MARCFEMFSEAFGLYFGTRVFSHQNQLVVVTP